MPRPYLEKLTMQSSVSYIRYATSYHEQTGNIITFVHFEEGYLVENEQNSEEDESIPASIDELSTENDSYGGSISTNALEDIWDGSKINLDINSRDARLKIRDHIRKTQNEWKAAELSAKSMGKVLHKVFKAVVK